MCECLRENIYGYMEVCEKYLCLKIRFRHWLPYSGSNFFPATLSCTHVNVCIVFFYCIVSTWLFPSQKNRRPENTYSLKHSCLFNTHIRQKIYKIKKLNDFMRRNNKKYSLQFVVEFVRKEKKEFFWILNQNKWAIWFPHVMIIYKFNIFRICKRERELWCLWHW